VAGKTSEIIQNIFCSPRLTEQKEEKPMKKIFSLMALIIVLSSLAAAQDKTLKVSGKHKDKDVAEIQKVIAEAMNEGWEKYDIEKSVAEYTNDVYWINAFGIQKEGKEEIKKFVAQIFTRPQFRNRKLGPLKFISIRFIRPGIASVHTYQETTDQLKADGTPEGLRRTHVFRIMLKRDGKWLTDSFQVMDVRP
jgi:uncharacterized protein (TIGR02246 family)